MVSGDLPRSGERCERAAEVRRATTDDKVDALRIAFEKRRTLLGDVAMYLASTLGGKALQGPAYQHLVDPYYYRKRNGFLGLGDDVWEKHVGHPVRMWRLVVDRKGGPVHALPDLAHDAILEAMATVETSRKRKREDSDTTTSTTAR